MTMMMMTTTVTRLVLLLMVVMMIDDACDADVDGEHDGDAGNSSKRTRMPPSLHPPRPPAATSRYHHQHDTGPRRHRQNSKSNSHKR